MTSQMDQMIAAFKQHGNFERGIEAVLAVLDGGVPPHIGKILHGDDEYYRVTPGGNVWRAECGCCYYTVPDIIEQFVTMDGPEITWEGKA